MGTEQEKQAETGKLIMLGQIHAEYAMPDGRKISIRRMGMKREMLFVDLYNKFVAEIASQQSTVISKLNEFMSGAKTVNFGIIEGLQMLGSIMNGLPRLQQFAIDGVKIIAQANGVDFGDDFLMDALSTADCFEIMGKQAEVQGLLSSFRGIAASLGALSQGERRS